MLASTDEGKIVADALKYKYWKDLPLACMISNLYLQKSRFECSQRFYVMGEEGITAVEALRFLNNRWLHLRAQEEKKVDSLADVGNQPLPATVREGNHKKRRIKAK